MRILPMVTKRLGNEERGAVAPGSVYIWEERGVDGASREGGQLHLIPFLLAEATGLGIERW